MRISTAAAFELGEREAEQDIQNLDRSALLDLAKTAKKDAYYARVYDRDHQEAEYWTAYAATIFDYLADNPDLD